jgi:hypothetical protein
MEHRRCWNDSSMGVVAGVGTGGQITPPGLAGETGRATPGGLRIEGTTAAIEDTRTWIVTYLIQLHTAWTTRSARITARTAAGLRETFLESDGSGHWSVDGRAAPHLDSCMDVELESSAMTNALPVHRMNMRAGDAPAAYVRA